MTLPVTGLTFAGMRPLPALIELLRSVATSMLADVPILCGCIMACCVIAGVAIAIRPGRITRNGKNIFGIAAMSGTRRADSSVSVAIAVWMTRKSVHQ